MKDFPTRAVLFCCWNKNYLLYAVTMNLGPGPIFNPKLVSALVLVRQTLCQSSCCAQCARIRLIFWHEVGHHPMLVNLDVILHTLTRRPNSLGAVEVYSDERG